VSYAKVCVETEIDQSIKAIKNETNEVIMITGNMK
jgi:hypothetical protein